MEDLDKIRRFCVATGARELLPDIMVLLKRLASSPQPPQDIAAAPVRHRLHRSVETYLNSSRGQRIRREHETMPLHGRPLGFQDDASFEEPFSFPGLRSGGSLDAAEMPDRPVAKPAVKPAGGRVPMRSRPERPSAAPIAAAAATPPQPPKAPRVEAAQPPPVGMVDTRPPRAGATDARPAAIPTVRGAPARSPPAPASTPSRRNADDAPKAGPRRRGKLNTRDLKPREMIDPEAVRAAKEFHDLMHSHAHSGKNAALDARAGAGGAAAVDPAQRAQQAAPAAVPEDVWSDSDFDAGQVADEALQQLRRPAGQHSVGPGAGGAVGGVTRPGAPLKSRPAHHAAPAAEHISQAEIDAAAAEFALPGAGADKAGIVDAELAQEEGPVEEALEALLRAPVDGGESWLDEIKRTGMRAGKGKKKGKANKARTSSRQRLSGNAASDTGSAEATSGAEVAADAVTAAEMAAEGRRVKPGTEMGSGKAHRQGVGRGDQASAVSSVMSAVSATSGGAASAGVAGDVPLSEEGGSAVHAVHGNGAAVGKGVASHPLHDVAASEVGSASSQQVTRKRSTVDTAAVAEAAAAADRAAAEAAAEEQAAAEAETAVQAVAEAAEAKKAAAAGKAAVARKAAAEALAATRAAAKAAAAEKAAAEAAAAEKVAEELAAAEKASAEAAAVKQAAADAAAAEKAAAEAAAAEEAAAEAAAAEEAAAEAAAVEKAAAEAAAAREAAAAAAARAMSSKQVQEEPQVVECEVVTDEQHAEARRRWAGADMDAADFTDGTAANMGDATMPHPLQWEPGAVGDSEQGVWVDVRQLMWDLAEQDPEIHAALEGMVGEDGDIPEEALDLITRQLMMEDGAVASASFGGSSRGRPRAQDAGRDDGSGSGRGFGGGGNRRRAVPRKHARQSAQRIADEVFEGASEERRGGGGSSGGGGWEHPLPPGVKWSNGR